MNIIINNNTIFELRSVGRLVFSIALILSLTAAVGCGPPPKSNFNISGTATGLDEFVGEEVFVKLNGGIALKVIENDEPFTFPNQVQETNGYNVTVSKSPAGKKCLVTNGAGTVSGEVTDIVVECVELDIADVVITDAALLQCISDTVGGALNVPISTLTALSCAGPDPLVSGPYDIQNTTGLEQFIHIESLNLYGISAASIDVSAMRDLLTLRLFINGLLDIDISQNALLQHLELQYNYLVDVIILDDPLFPHDHLQNVHFDNNCWNSEAQEYYQNGYTGSAAISWSIRPDC